MKFCGLLIFVVVAIASAQGDGTALDALKLLPKDAARRLALIEAREGAPVPERWYFLVHDPAEERGVREYVVADGKLAGSRTLSQFAEVLKPGDVFGADAVKIDSSYVARLAAAFAEANGGKLASLNYELARDATTGVPVWKATVLDASGDQLGILILTAARGGLLSSAGFEIMPAADFLIPPTVTAEIPHAATVQRKRATPTPSPKPGLLKRIFGNNEKRPKSDQ